MPFYVSLPFTKLNLITAVSYTSPNEEKFLPSADFREHDWFLEHIQPEEIDESVLERKTEFIVTCKA